MFLRGLKLRNVRSITAFDLPFWQADGGRASTYLLGENGTGKSSVLRAISLVLAGGKRSQNWSAIPIPGYGSEKTKRRSRWNSLRRREQRGVRASPSSVDPACASSLTATRTCWSSWTPQ
jgi:recombinational DNA repair ATPase RecF